MNCLASSGKVKTAVPQQPAWPSSHAAVADDDGWNGLLARLGSPETDVPVPAVEQELVEGLCWSSQQTEQASHGAKGCLPQVITGPLSGASLKDAWCMLQVHSSSTEAAGAQQQHRGLQDGSFGRTNAMFHPYVTQQVQQGSQVAGAVGISTAYTVPLQDPEAPTAAPVALQHGHAMAHSRSCSKLSARTSLAKPTKHRKGLRSLTDLTATCTEVSP